MCTLYLYLYFCTYIVCHVCVQGQVWRGVSAGGHAVGGEGRDHGRPHDHQHLSTGKHDHDVAQWLNH